MREAYIFLSHFYMSTDNSQNYRTGTGVSQLALPAGVTLGQYRIIRKLGQGGFGITYLAEITTGGEHVVIKENLPTFCAMRNHTTLQVTATDPDDELQEYAEYLKRFVDEACLLAQLNHPNIVKVLGAFEGLGTAYYVMPWVGGKELQKAAPAPGVITESWLLPILRTMLSTLEYLHSNNIYHRDVKPANILLTAEGSPVLIDFGTARAIISDRSATHVGSPGYSPIEQLRSKGKRGPWTDVYSLGATCYRLITGERPPEAFDRLDEDEDPLRPLAPRAELHGRFSPAFLATIDKALALRSKDRWQTATAWYAALPVPITHPSDDEPISCDIPTFPIVMNQTEKGSIETAATNTEKRMGVHRKWIWFSIWIIGSISLFWGWLWAYASILLIAGLFFYTLFPLTWLLRETSKAKSMLCLARNVVILYVLATLFSFTDEFGRTFTNSAEEGYPISLLFCLSLLGTDVNEEWGGSTALKNAAHYGHSVCVKLLLAAPSIDVNKANYFGKTPLHEAASYGHSDCVKLLLAAPGIDVNKATHFGDTPILEAASDGHSDCVKLLLAAPGINGNQADADGNTPLLMAACNGHSDCVKLLLAAPGINVNQVDADGETPLHKAARKGCSDCVKLLLAAPGINVNQADSDGMTPRQVADSWGHSECIRLIREAGGHR